LWDVSDALLHTLEVRLGARGLLRGDQIGERYAADTSRLHALRPGVVLRPASTGDVAFILAACHAAGQSIVIQGGLTGLCGGGTPQPGEFAMSLERLTGIEEIDPAGLTMTVRAGTPLQTIQEAAADAGLRFPLDLGARGSCTIGGNISTNAGGNEVIRYGMARALVLGVEAVLPDGTVVSSLNKMLKNNAGFDLKQLFIGSEGALGIVTRAVLRLFPQPLTHAAAMCAAPDLPHVIKLLQHLRVSLGEGLSAFELMWPNYVQYITSQCADIHNPIDSAAHILVLIEFEGTRPDTDRATFEAVLHDAMTAGHIVDAVLAKSDKEVDDFWRLRDGIGDVAPRLANAAHFDISVPINAMPELVDGMTAELAQAFDGITLLTFGHLADSNLHLVAATGNSADLDAIYHTVYERVGTLQGSVSAEHGIGMVKKKYLHLSRSESEIALMRTLKAALDPKGILNPGRVIP